MNNVLIVIMLSVGGAFLITASVEIIAVAICVSVQWVDRSIISRGK